MGSLGRFAESEREGDSAISREPREIFKIYFKKRKEMRRIEMHIIKNKD